MKKLLSFVIAAAISMSSGAMLIQAAPSSSPGPANSFGVPSSDTVNVPLTVELSTPGGAYASYPDPANPLIASNFYAKAAIDMDEVAQKWEDYVQAGMTYLSTSNRSDVVNNVDLSDSRFTVKVTVSSSISNSNVVLGWSTKTTDLFEQESAATTSADGNTIYTVVMKPKATNADFDTYFSAINADPTNTGDELTLEIVGTSVTNANTTFPVNSNFSGNIVIDVPYINDMTLAFDSTDVDYVRYNYTGGGGGGARPTAKPTAKPTATPSAEPTVAPSEAPTEAPSAEPTVAPTEAPAVTVAPQTGGTSSGAKLNYEDHYAYIIGYDVKDGAPVVRPEQSITRAEVATIFFRLLDDESRDRLKTRVNDFTDVEEGDWYNVAISTVAAAGIVNGYDDGSFGPDKKITRAEFATIASRFSTLSHDGDHLFNDIDGHWAAEFINNASITGWVNGYDDGSFKPEAQITRAEAITLINRVLYRFVHEDDLHEDMITWPDNTPDKWYYTAMQEATNSHDYSRFDIGHYETHTAIEDPHDWEAIEK